MSTKNIIASINGSYYMSVDNFLNQYERKYPGIINKGVINRTELITAGIIVTILFENDGEEFIVKGFESPKDWTLESHGYVYAELF